MDISFLVGITPFLTLKKYKAGEYLYNKGDYPQNIYFLLEGKVGFYNESN